MSPVPCLLGIDLGTSSVKAALVSEAGSMLSRGSAEYAILRPQTGHSEQEPEAWWRAVCDAVHSALGAVEPAVEVAAVGLSGQMHGTVLLGDGGEPLSPAIIWPDQRSAAQVEEIAQALGLEKLTELTGSPVATGFQAATLLWLKQERPELWQKIGKVLLPKDYIRWRLTGQFATDPSDGSGTLLLDVRRRDWAPELLSLLELDCAQLPGVQPARAAAGALRAEAAAELGLEAGIPVVTGAADTACSALGAGAIDPGLLLLTLSSGGQLLQPIGEVCVDIKGRIHTFCSALEPVDGPGWYQMGAILSAGLALSWLRNEVFAVGGEDAYERMSAWASESPPGAHGLLFLPYLAGERTPHMDPHARGMFLGLTAQHGRGHLVRAVMEGVTLACYDAYGVLAELGASPEGIILAGGGARSAEWRQIVADVFGLPVHPLAVAEQSALGAAILAGAGAGWFDAREAARTWATHGETVAPNPDLQRGYGELYDVFRTAYRQNAGLFRRLEAWP